MEVLPCLGESSTKMEEKFWDVASKSSLSLLPESSATRAPSEMLFFCIDPYYPWGERQ